MTFTAQRVILFLVGAWVFTLVFGTPALGPAVPTLGLIAWYLSRLVRAVHLVVGFHTRMTSALRCVSRTPRADGGRALAA
jgi:hypothetical protein